ncbi:hypothetical protein NDU88_003885 [Pleurodeles waltl]|uniref:Uncharacterized protein n=1 Tax=Pleurodeles waltl TaxID=8319 RepID=A0AAV7LGI0_PLEWA|nr:hypothetical protein NDU88_003885 [Pleurodeles waltl]
MCEHEDANVECVSVHEKRECCQGERTVAEGGGGRDAYSSRELIISAINQRVLAQELWGSTRTALGGSGLSNKDNGRVKANGASHMDTQQNEEAYK